MVVAQQMQHGVNGQEGDFTLQRMAVERCLLLSTFHADDDIPQHLAAVVLIHVVNAVFSQRKAQHIGGHRLVAVLIVQLCNGSVIHKSHADLSRLIEVLIFQHSIAGAADQDPQARRYFYGFL